MTPARLSASALICANLLIGCVLTGSIGLSPSCLERCQTSAACPLNLAGWPMPSDSGGPPLTDGRALRRLLLRLCAQVVEALARMCGHLAFRPPMRALALQGAVNYADLAAAQA
jgi:hypothetical protein